MTDATQPLPVDKEAKTGLGRNQLIGIGMTALPIVLGFVLVCTGKLDAQHWAAMSAGSTAVGTGATLGISGLIKAVEAWRK
jgi:hypothetical protein